MKHIASVSGTTPAKGQILQFCLMLPVEPSAFEKIDEKLELGWTASNCECPLGVTLICKDV